MGETDGEAELIVTIICNEQVTLFLLDQLTV